MKKESKKSTKGITSSNTKIAKIIFIIFILLSLLTLARLIKKPPSPPKLPSVEKTSGKKIEISGVKVKDFTQGFDKNQEQSYITLNRTKDYHILYIPDQEFFLVSIVSYPFDQYRLVAEVDFLDKLQIAEDDACKLKVSVTTPAFANPDKAGKEYKLSFCE